MKRDELKARKILRGPLFPEPVEALICTPVPGGVKLTGHGLNTDKVYALVLRCKVESLMPIFRENC